MTVDVVFVTKASKNKCIGHDTFEVHAHCTIHGGQEREKTKTYREFKKPTYHFLKRCKELQPQCTLTEGYGKLASVPRVHKTNTALSNVIAKRVTYVGELGWELYVTPENARAVYDTLFDAGQDLGLADAGYYAMEALRLEKAYRAWGHELTPHVSPIEAGL